MDSSAAAMEEGTKARKNEAVDDRHGKEAHHNEESPSSSENSNPPKVSVPELFRYADGTDWVLIVVGTILSLGNGVILPMFAILFGACAAVSDGGTLDHESRAHCMLSRRACFIQLLSHCIRCCTVGVVIGSVLGIFPAGDLMDNLNDEDAVLDEVENIALVFFILVRSFVSYAPQDLWTHRSSRTSSMIHRLVGPSNRRWRP